MNWLSTIKVKLFAAVALVVAFVSFRSHYIRTGKRLNEAEVEEQDRKNADRVGEKAQAAKDRAAADSRSPTERVRSLGGLRDG